MRTARFTSRLPVVSRRIISHKAAAVPAAAARSITLIPAATKNVTTTKSSSFQQVVHRATVSGKKNHHLPQQQQQQLTTIRSFSTQFREDYDAWYSHGLTGVQTQSDQRGIYFGDNADVVTFGVQQPQAAVSAMKTVVDNDLDDYDLEDAYLDYSEDEFESWIPTSNKSNTNDTIVSVDEEEMSYYH